jgi:hypothetical protein
VGAENQPVMSASKPAILRRKGLAGRISSFGMLEEILHGEPAHDGGHSIDPAVAREGVG